MNCGLVNFADSRDEVYNKRALVIEEYRSSLKENLKIIGIDVFDKYKIVRSIDDTRLAIENCRNENINTIILHVPTWADPINVVMAVILAKSYNIKIFLLGNLDNHSASLGAMLVISGTLKAAGIKVYYLNCDYNDLITLKQIQAFINAANVTAKLKGSLCGRIGGKALGIYTADVDELLILKKFGILIKDLDELAIIQNLNNISEKKVDKHLYWLKEYCGYIEYDGQILNEEILRKQIKSYLSLRDIVQKEKFDCIGLRCQTELSDYYVNQCIGVALINDPYDADGLKKPIPCACESDIDGAITMLILNYITDTPVAFGDYRIIEKVGEKLIWTICNCGAMSTWFSKCSNDCKKNLHEVHLIPQVQGKAGGAATQFIAKSGWVTTARLGRIKGKYVMVAAKRKAIGMPRSYLKKSKWPWPHIYLEMNLGDEKMFYNNWPCNHVCSVYGDYLEELEIFCELNGIKAVIL